MAKKSAQLNIRVEPEDLEVLEKIEQEHYISPSLLTRGLLKAAIEFYTANGWFSFPVSVDCEIPSEAAKIRVGGKVPPEVVKSAQEARIVKKK